MADVNLRDPATRARKLRGTDQIIGGDLDEPDAAEAYRTGTTVDELIADVLGQVPDGRELVLQAPVATGSAAGVTSVTLPVDYATYEYLEIVGYVSGDGTQASGSVNVQTAWLAVQTDASNTRLGIDTAEDGDQQYVTWTPSTRTIGRGGQTNTRLRIVSARLHDGGAKGAPGDAGTIADNSITPAKAQADTAERRKAWRLRLASAHIGAGAALPTAAATNDGDVWIFPQDVAAGLSWRDISDIATEITSAAAGDVGLYFGRSGWTRVGNILSAYDPDAYAADRRLDLNFLPFLSPASIDKSNVPTRILVTVKLRQGDFSTGRTLRMQFGGVTQNQAVNVGSFTELAGVFNITTAVANAIAAETGTTMEMVVRLLDGNGVTLAVSELPMALVTTSTTSSPGDGTDQTARNSAAEALAAARGNTEDITDLEGQTADLDRRVETVSWANAVSADAQLAYSQNLTAAGVVRLISGNSFDPATDLVAANFVTSGGNVLWFTSRTVPQSRALLMRVRRGLFAPQFRVDVDGGRTAMHRFRLRGSDANWDYYYAGNSDDGGSVTVVVQRRSPDHPTLFGGELVGQAAAQVATAQSAAADAQTDADTALHFTRRLQPITRWVRGGHARTLRFHWRPRIALHTTANAISVTIGGQTLRITAPEGLAAGNDVGTVLSVPITTAQATNISGSTNARNGYVQAQVTYEGVRDTCYVEAVDLVPKWREVSGSSPFTITAEDDEFRFEVTHSSSGIYNIDVLRAQLTAGTAAKFAIAEQRPDGTINSARLSVTINAAGTALTVATEGSGGGTYTIAAVYAKGA
ncbi:MAG: hypothetical protein OXC29_20320 [Rhodococcus sp.]|nr:hypothetical protein [Rhodococcus sp. (in: high G+C Gram-positive bacteria)]